MATFAGSHVAAHLGVARVFLQSPFDYGVVPNNHAHPTLKLALFHHQKFALRYGVHVVQIFLNTNLHL